MSAVATELRKSQLAVLSVLRRRPSTGSTDEQLVNVYSALAQSGRVPMQTASGIRTRRNELVRAGLVVDSGIKRLMSTGGLGRVWVPVK